MKMKFKAAAPDEIQLTMEITMSIWEWNQFRNELTTNYPAWKISRAINKVVADTESALAREVETDGATL